MDESFHLETHPFPPLLGMSPTLSHCFMRMNEKRKTWPLLFLCLRKGAWRWGAVRSSLSSPKAFPASSHPSPTQVSASLVLGAKTTLVWIWEWRRKNNVCDFHHFSRHGYFPLPLASLFPGSCCHFESFARVSLRHTSCVFAQTVFAKKYVKAFGLWFLVQNMPMFSFARGSVSVDVLKR